VTAGGDASADSPDLAALPPELAKQSISNASVMLPKQAALDAIELLTSRGRCLVNWEGWVRFPNGSRAKSLNHSGSFALSRDARRAAETATAGIQRAQAAWDRSPEYQGAALYFGLTFSAK